MLLVSARHQAFSENFYTYAIALSFSLLLIIFALKVSPHKKIYIIPNMRILDNKKLLILITACLFFFLPQFLQNGWEALSDPYAVRADNSNNFSVFGRYLLNLLIFAIIPVSTATAIANGSRVLLLLSLLGFFVLFIVSGVKMILAMVAMFFAIYYLLNGKNLANPQRILLIPIGASLLFWLNSVIEFESQILYSITSQIYMRGIAIQGAAFANYVDYFTSAEKTYLSHNSLISHFIDYPFDQPLGFVVGGFITKGIAFNANSHFWSSEAIAGFGFAGVFLVPIFVVPMLIIMDMLTKKVDIRLTVLALVPFCMAASNTSIFTSFITGGGLLACLLLSQIKRRSIS